MIQIIDNFLIIAYIAFFVLFILGFIYLVLTIVALYVRSLLYKKMKKYPHLQNKIKNRVSKFGPFYLMDRSEHKRLVESFFILLDKSQNEKDKISFDNWYYFKDIQKTKDSKLISSLEEFRKAEKRWLFVGRLLSFLMILIFSLSIIFFVLIFIINIISGGRIKL